MVPLPCRSRSTLTWPLIRGDRRVSFGTGSRTVVRTTEGIRQYFERALLTDRPRGAVLESHSAVVLSDGAVVVTGCDTTTAVRDGKTISSPGRVTFVIAQREDTWRIVHFHRSPVPGGAQAK